MHKVNSLINKILKQIIIRATWISTFLEDKARRLSKGMCPLQRLSEYNVRKNTECGMENT